TATPTRGGLTAYTSGKASGPVTRPITIAARIPYQIAWISERPRRQRNTVSAGASSIGSAWGRAYSPIIPSRLAESAAPPLPNRDPTTAYRTIETAAAATAYFSRLRTTSPSSVPWVVTEAIVVSEIGAMLSPKRAPL